MICPSTEGGGVVLRQAGLVGAASGELVDGVRQLRPEDAMVEAMLRGWRAQQSARGLRVDTIDYRERLVRRFVSFTNEFPWRWGPGHVDEWTLTLTAEHYLSPATIRGYQTDLRLFSEYLTDARYGWVGACEDAFGEFPVPICHEWNTIAHLNDYEGSPEARPLSREELQRFLDYADEQVERAARARRKGGLAAYRDATMFKVIYGWGLRRTETAKLDLADWGRNPAAPVGQIELRGLGAPQSPTVDHLEHRRIPVGGHSTLSSGAGGPFDLIVGIVQESLQLLARERSRLRAAFVVVQVRDRVPLVTDRHRELAASILTRAHPAVAGIGQILAEQAQISLIATDRRR